MRAHLHSARWLSTIVKVRLSGLFVQGRRHSRVASCMNHSEQHMWAQSIYTMNDEDEDALNVGQLVGESGRRVTKYERGEKAGRAEENEARGVVIEVRSTRCEASGQEGIQQDRCLCVHSFLKLDLALKSGFNGRYQFPLEGISQPETNFVQRGT